MKKVETYLLEEHECLPTVEHIQKCIEIAKVNDCIVSLEWVVPYSGRYSRYINAEDDAQDFYNKKIPKIYGV